MYLAFVRIEQVPRDMCYLNTIAVDDSFRGKGIGKVLLDFADEQARKHGAKVRLVHTVFSNNVDRVKPSKCTIKMLGFSQPTSWEIVVLVTLFLFQYSALLCR